MLELVVRVCHPEDRVLCRPKPRNSRGVTQVLRFPQDDNAWACPDPAKASIITAYGHHDGRLHCRPCHI